jgi:hypothetical protein
LNLNPWEVPTDDFFWDQDKILEVLASGPEIGTEIGAGYKCATLAKQLLDAGLSLHEPDPERALNDPDYRKKIKERVRKLKATNRNGLTDQAIETVILLAPYPLMRPTFEDPRAEKETTEFHKLLAEQPGVRDIAACERVIDMMLERHREEQQRAMKLHRWRNSLR